MQDTTDPVSEPPRTSVAHFAASALQLGLLVYAIRAFRLEESFGLVAITPVVFFGFCVHAWLPRSSKLPFFLALSLAAIFVVLGALPGAILVGLSLALFGICHLPVPFALRVALLAATGLLLAVLRIGWIESSWAAAVLPVLAAMFMFRSVLYLYDMRTEARPASIWMRLSYFFLLPNVCFLLFPVVDYRTFQRTYCAAPLQDIHQRGMQWILRGILHLLLYRVVYFYLTPTPSEIADLAGVTMFVVSSYLLYLRISGHFHLIVGILHLFGFGLPETNHRYLLASSFTDCWRRINVYWTEFMKTVVYFPAFVRLRRRRGMLFGMLGATALTFVATWLLHTYQWFWLHGAFPLATDGLFWGVAGALALGSMFWESSRGAQSALRRGAPSWGAALRRSVQTLAVFSLICILWSLWCCSSFEQWLGILSQARHGPRSQVLTLLGGAAGLLAAGTLAQRVAHGSLGSLALGFPRRAALTGAGALAVALLGHVPVREALGRKVAAAMLPIAGDPLNDRDRERMVTGYYERLIDREAFGSRVSEERHLDPNAPEAFADSDLFFGVDGPLLWELPRSRRVEYLGALVETNRWGMRDRDYALRKPADTFRIAVLGTCYEMGAGVTNDRVWEALAEERLNRDLSPRTGLAYEILNFSVPAYNVLNLVTLVREKVSGFEPDVVVVSNHVRSSEEYLLYLATGGTATPIDIDTLFQLETVEASWPQGLAEVLAPARTQPDVDWESMIEDWAFAGIAAACAEIGALPVFLSLPYLEPMRDGGYDPAQVRTATQVRLAQQHGFECLDLGAAFAGESFEALAIVPTRCCPNEAGHRLLGERFYEALLAKPHTVGAP